MKTEFSKDQVSSALNRLDEAIKVMDEEQEKGIAFDYKYLADFIDAVFEFDFFAFQKEVGKIQEQLKEIAYKIGAKEVK